MLYDTRMNHTISVIIPTLFEEEGVASAIESAWAAGANQVIVADGGSSDETVRIARQRHAEVVVSEPGRGIQQNAGAAMATGDVLLFQHADCRLGPACLDQLREALIRDETLVFGGFRQRIDAADRKYRWLEHGNALRVRALGLVYGDQAIFVRRERFDQVGGFPSIPLMEDVSLIRRLRQSGDRPRLLAGPIEVSARRWQRTGVVAQTVRNWTLLWAYFCGVPPGTLIRFYPRHDDNPA